MGEIAMSDASKTIDLHPSWLRHLVAEFEQPYMKQLKAFLLAEKRQGKVIYPASKNIFNAFNSTPLDQVKVVILGQDPYHGPNQAHGLCFSVQPGVPSAPSLQNMFKELHRDLGFDIPSHGCLQSWANQGVLLLNATLTVEQAKAGAHQGQGWETFTDKAIQLVNDQCQGVVFLLWGSYAQKKASFINSDKHLVLKAPHPSPLSAYRGFIGCGHFSAANDYLKRCGKLPIVWQL
ncbi:MAG: uracil-DNA glycosylase [Cellvibrio sp.]|uniref:uracil-DNA glycosylase n=1 Tax=Cellvibrio sp. TaxID=1965322 RepID=UPI002718CDEE|nr:uracil-DNA glycosylase [Cellvibrio sp.]